ncbi:CocE/NonD family hydrolase [Paracrocinitomix mangrovi]|uniref:CocE/NonD family hydrolase n=1 Tax=Paracrocinitomix mangrovi TaxID=2862509 RepID=UPI001C8DD45D|nr:CocE/NonD family hydrolase [Paracrocinitomix mangrovi]UKN00965.1 CocE/NonD family hydrolase [Paracrocinitomix mangrovi]
MKTINLLLLLFVFGSTTHAQLTPTLNDIWIPMSDGDSLSADVYIPSTVTTGEVILVQTPYNKNGFQLGLPLGIGSNLDNQAYIWVIVDWRGFYGSSGADLSNVDRAQDAYDICDWIVAQTWHGDRIGTWGPSALGGVQYQLCTTHHPNHTCAVPMVATGTQSYESYFYGGVLEEARLNQLDALGYGVSTVVMANVYDSFAWDIADNNSWYADDISIPTLQIGGWYDHNIDMMMTFYKDARSMADVAVQDEQWLLVGPWVHGGDGAAYVGSPNQGQLTYTNAAYKSDSMAWDFFNYYLLDSVNNWQNTDLITYFDMGGTDTWLTSNADDIAIPNYDILYLDQNGGLISSTGIDSSTFISDPSNPSPTIGGATLSQFLDQGPYDQSSLDARTDIVTFTSAALNQDVSITGRIQLDLWISADQADCDISVRLVDQYPGGENMLITDGIKRMRFRNNDYTQSGEVFMVPGEVYNVQVDLPFTQYTWKAGHKIKIYVGGNHAIRFNVNLQDGGTMYQAGSGNIANISVHHNSTYPSQIKLPGNNTTLDLANESSTTFKLYPNPATDKLFIQTNKAINRIKIYNTNGKEVLKENNVSSAIIDIASFQSGMYFIQLTFADQTTLVDKFIVK